MVLPTWGSALALLALLVLPAPVRGQTTTPIAHLIVVVGENLSFDNLFGAYEPRSNATIRNLLSQRIVNRDRILGPEFTIPAPARTGGPPLWAFTTGPQAPRPISASSPILMRSATTTTSR